MVYHPTALLIMKRNIRPGLDARTKIVQTLESGALESKTIIEKTHLSKSQVAYHLHLLKIEKIVSRQKKPRTWELTGAGQQRL